MSDIKEINRPMILGWNNDNNRTFLELLKKANRQQLYYAIQTVGEEINERNQRGI